MERKFKRKQEREIKEWMRKIHNVGPTPLVWIPRKVRTTKGGAHYPLLQIISYFLGNSNFKEDSGFGKKYKTWEKSKETIPRKERRRKNRRKGIQAWTSKWGPPPSLHAPCGPPFVAKTQIHLSFDEIIIRDGVHGGSFQRSKGWSQFRVLCNKKPNMEKLSKSLNFFHFFFSSTLIILLKLGTQAG